MSCKGQKESLSRLVPQWEQALEPDLTRAIARAIEDRTPVPSAAVARADAKSLEAVRRTIPNVETVSLEDGTQMLRDASLAQITRTVAEIDSAVKAAERSLQSQENPSDASRLAAQDKIRKIQAEGTEKLKETAQNARAEIAALQQLKRATP